LLPRGLSSMLAFLAWANYLNFTFLIQWQQNFHHLTRV
jgi:hypothetical protein